MIALGLFVVLKIFFTIPSKVLKNARRILRHPSVSGPDRNGKDT